MTASAIDERYHVTAVIAHSVKPGREAGYEQWLRGIMPVAKAFPGHIGVNILRPQPDQPPDYRAILHFDCHQTCNAGWSQMSGASGSDGCSR